MSFGTAWSATPPGQVTLHKTSAWIGLAPTQVAPCRECSPAEALAEDIPDSFADRASARLQLQEPPKCERLGNPRDTQHVCSRGADFLQLAVELAQFGCLIWPENGLSGSQLSGSDSHRFVFSHSRRCYAEAPWCRVTGLTVGAHSGGRPFEVERAIRAVSIRIRMARVRCWPNSWV